VGGCYWRARSLGGHPADGGLSDVGHAPRAGLPQHRLEATVTASGFQRSPGRRGGAHVWLPVVRVDPRSPAVSLLQAGDYDRSRGASPCAVVNGWQPALDELLPAERVVAVDSGNFVGCPRMFLSVPDEYGFCFTQACQSIGLGLATAIGAALAQPERLAVAALGDGGARMAAAELDTLRRLGLPMVVVVYNDAAYCAQVYHFTDGQPLETVTMTIPDTDSAAIARGNGLDAVTVRAVADIDSVRRWLDGTQDQSLLIDAKVAAPRG